MYETQHRSFPRIAPKILAAFAALAAFSAVLLATAGCGSVASQSKAPAELGRSIRSLGLDPASVVIPYKIDDEMRAWAHRQVPDDEPMDKKLQLLLTGLVDPRYLKLEYEPRHTGTAEEVFRSRRANCLAFTSLFVGLAREVGVPVFFLDVDDVEKFEKEGDLVVVSGHVSAGYGMGKDLRILDFAAAPQRGYRKVRRISDLRAISLFHSNRGAELLRAAKDAEAVEWLSKAVALDPEFVRPWINYGVALRRTGDFAGAEAAYRKALEIDVETVSAYQNLASLLRAQGRNREAEELLSLTAEIDTRNPFSYLALGDLSLSHHRFEEARRFYRRALRLYRDNAEPYAALGLLSLAVGDSGDAQRWLRKAVAIDQENFRVKQLLARMSGNSKSASSRVG